MAREEELAKYVDEAERRVAAEGTLDLEAFLAEAPDELRDELHKLISMILVLRPKRPGGPPSAPRAPLDDLPGYDIYRRLAPGSKGDAYLAWSEALERWVTLHVLPAPEGSGESRLTERVRDLERVAQFDHANVVPVLDVGQFGELIYVATEPIDGETLSETVSRMRDQRGGPGRSARAVAAGASGPLTFQDLARIVRTIALIVEVARTRGLRLEGLNPGDVCLDGSGKPWLQSLAFRLATPPPAGAYPPSDGAREDVQQIGLFLYELLTLRPAIETARDAGANHLTGPRQIDRSIPKGLESIAQRACAPEPAGRQASAAVLAEELDHFAKRVPPRGLFRGLRSWLRASPR
ncbi:Serine/threonine-protein kinase PrkC [Planctomycetes bacterium Poly30]|uniref:Serine/threonine-protein kinase PrkC n=1 Tax=Saltatorellus ferox TaxID=2528018 RepID=A0A518EWS4_9BACT|nr:Serine/threonine-protein kinase PrkC [Planctomycetes bacterium Poly30]